MGIISEYGLLSYSSDIRFYINFLIVLSALLAYSDGAGVEITF